MPFTFTLSMGMSCAGYIYFPMSQFQILTLCGRGFKVSVYHFRTDSINVTFTSDDSLYGYGFNLSVAFVDLRTFLFSA